MIGLCLTLLNLTLVSAHSAHYHLPHDPVFTWFPQLQWQVNIGWFHEILSWYGTVAIGIVILTRFIYILYECYHRNLPYAVGPIQRWLNLISTYDIPKPHWVRTRDEVPLQARLARRLRRNKRRRRKLHYYLMRRCRSRKQARPLRDDRPASSRITRSTKHWKNPTNDDIWFDTLTDESQLSLWTSILGGSLNLTDTGSTTRRKSYFDLS